MWNSGGLRPLTLGQGWNSNFSSGRDELGILKDFWQGLRFELALKPSLKLLCLRLMRSFGVCFRARFALSKEGFCSKLITVRRIFIKSIISHPMIIRKSPHPNRVWLRELHLAQKGVCTCNSRNQSVS